MPVTCAKTTGFLIVISSPSGGGKTTVIHEVRKRRPEFGYSVSCTTREPRIDEVNGRDYIFISESEFKHRIEQGELLEWEWVHRHRYGTLRNTVLEALESGQKLLFDLDVFGARSIKKAFPESLLIFLKPPDLDTLKRRLILRAEDSQVDISIRLQRVDLEMEMAKDFDKVIINDNLSDTVNQVLEAIDQWSLAQQQ